MLRDALALPPVIPWRFVSGFRPSGRAERLPGCQTGRHPSIVGARRDVVRNFQAVCSWLPACLQLALVTGTYIQLYALPHDGLSYTACVSAVSDKCGHVPETAAIVALHRCRLGLTHQRSATMNTTQPL